MKVTPQRIYTSDNLELFGLLYEPDTVTKTIFIEVHGMGGNFYENKFLDSIAQKLTDNGIAFFTFNNRGCEFIKDLYKVTGDRRDIVRIGDAFERFEDCILDISAAINFAQAKNYSAIHLGGHSLGSPKVAYYAIQKGNSELASVVFLSPADMVGLALVEKTSTQDRRVAEQMLAEGKGSELMPGIVRDEYYLSPNTYMDLSDRSSKVSIFNLYDPNDPLSELGNITIPALTIMGRKDGALTVPVEELMDRVKKALKSSARAETEILGDANHGYIGYEDRLADRIAAWVMSF